MPFPPEIMWPRAMAWTRVALAAAALGWGYFDLPRQPSLYEGLFGLFLVYSIFAAIGGGSRSGMLDLLALFGDAIYFLIVASRGPAMEWLAAAFLLYALTEAISFGRHPGHRSERGRRRFLCGLASRRHERTRAHRVGGRRPGLRLRRK